MRARPGLVWTSLVATALLATLTPCPARAVPLEVYGSLPSLEDVALSPDGSRIALVRTAGDTREVLVLSLHDHKMLGQLRAGDTKLRSLEWADDAHLLIVLSKTADWLPFGGAGLVGRAGLTAEWFKLLVYDVDTKEQIEIPNLPTIGDIKVARAVFGPIEVRSVDGHTVVFARAQSADFSSIGGTLIPGGDYRGPTLIRADLGSGTERLLHVGVRTTIRLVVDESGQIAARLDYDDFQHRWAVSIYHSGETREIASGDATVDIPRVLGLGPAADTLLMEVYEDGDPTWRLLSLKDGTMGPPLAERRSLSGPITDRRTSRVIGGVYIDDHVHYTFFDDDKMRNWAVAERTFPGARLRLASWSADFTKLVVRVEGAADGFQYELVDLGANTAVPLGPVYEGIKVPLAVRSITYDAGDGLKIPAFLTLPRGRDARKLPLVVLPHGGPATRDTAEFNWWAQALADRGYAVLQPNFRGSDLRRRFLEAGFGEWGRKMQSDLSDGVRYLASEGSIDPARVCIVGASYGGYAALAAVTLEPSVYRCAVAVAGLSDLRRQLRWINNKHLNTRSFEQRYWDRYMGVAGANDPMLDSISPIEHIDAITAPVLLIHGRDDSVVPFEQSEVMYDALRHAHKAAEMVELKHEDHWLSRSETRLQMLQATVDFLQMHNPPD